MIRWIIYDEEDHNPLHFVARLEREVYERELEMERKIIAEKQQQHDEARNERGFGLRPETVQASASKAETEQCDPKRFIVVADPFDQSQGPFSSQRVIHTFEGALSAAKSLSRKHRRSFYVAQLVYKTELADVTVVPVT